MPNARTNRPPSAGGRARVCQILSNPRLRGGRLDPDAGTGGVDLDRCEAALLSDLAKMGLNFRSTQDPPITSH
jgi:hypothetical protein